MPPNFPDYNRQEQIGAVVSTRLSKMGLSDIRGHLVTWIAGTSWVGNGTDGTTNSVYFATASKTYLIGGFGSGSSGAAPVLGADTDVGATYVKDIEKHYQRKVIRKAWINVDSLQPSTSNNMMLVVAPSRGGGQGQTSLPITFATSAVTANSVAGVSSMNGAFCVDSWQSKRVDVTKFIAGGSGAKQNEFEIGNNLGAGYGYPFYSGGSDNPTDMVCQGVVPFCFSVAGNNTTSALQGTSVHQISITLLVDYLDYIGNNAQTDAID